MQERDKLMVIYSHEDRGNSRGYYRPVNKKDKRLFCYQPNSAWISQWYICSKDGEPSHEVTELEIVEITR
jgi:hypothetical protein